MRVHEECLESRGKDDTRPGSGKRVHTAEDDSQTAASPTAGEQQFSPERRSNMGSYSSTTHPPISISGVLNMEEDEEEMFKTMPWLKVRSSSLLS